jgi:acyl carrier protein
MSGETKERPAAGAVIAWLREEGIVELDVDFPDAGDLFAAGLDSMAVMQLVVAAEDRFGAVLGPADLAKERLATPMALAALLGERMA